jgi:hypothetical protein
MGSNDGVTGGIVYEILCLSNGDVYVGGAFTSAVYNGSNVPGTAYIAKWNGSTWSALSITLNGIVHSITEGSSGEIYIGGEFTQVDSTPAYRIVKYIP